jgi:uncharacterized OB-fold protein
MVLMGQISYFSKKHFHKVSFGKKNKKFIGMRCESGKLVFDLQTICPSQLNTYCNHEANSTSIHQDFPDVAAYAVVYGGIFAKKNYRQN